MSMSLKRLVCLASMGVNVPINAKLNRAGFVDPTVRWRWLISQSLNRQRGTRYSSPSAGGGFAGFDKESAAEVVLILLS